MVSKASPQHYRWEDVQLEELNPSISRKLVTGEREMMAQVFLKRGVLVPWHRHESEQITYILKGALRFWLEGGEEVVVREGEVLVIPSNLEHQAEALEDTVDLDVFSPIRQDWLEKTDAYLRK